MDFFHMLPNFGESALCWCIFMQVFFHLMGMVRFFKSKKLFKFNWLIKFI